MDANKMIKEGFNARQVLVLELLKEGVKSPSMMASDILSPITITTVTDYLVKRKLVQRVRSKKDRRKIMLTLTDAGHEILK